MKKEKVVIGLSGGVDSSVAAYLLKEQGYDVIGLFMINWHDTTGTLEGDCPWHDDRVFAELVARRLDIPFHVVDLSEQYRTRVVDYMFSEYEKGRTPNPDVLCNREIKFDVFLKEALKLGADHVATGHYCRRRDDITADVGNEITGSAANDSKNIAEDIAEKSSGNLSESTETDSNNIAENTATVGRKIYHRLLAGADPNKDQSYFLCQLSQEQLSKALFPIGDLLKPEVRRIAEELKLATARRKDSQGICFVGKVDLPVFLQQKLSVKQGDIVEIAPDWPGYASLCAASQQTCAKVTSSDENTAKQTICDSAYLKKLASPHSYSPQDGVKIGTHQGAHFFTIGQRKGLGLGGRREPLFIIGTDVERNIVYVGEGYAHPGLFRPALFIRSDEMHWISPDRAIPVGGSASFQVRIRYRQPLQQATLHVEPEGGYIVFDEAQRGITSGQFAAWYSGEELVGSGVIDN